MKTTNYILLGLIAGLGLLGGCASSSSDTHSTGFYPDYVKLAENPISTDNVIVFDWRASEEALPKNMHYNVTTSPELSTGNIISNKVLKQSKKHVKKVLSQKISKRRNKNELTVEIVYLGVAGHHFGFRDVLPVVFVIDAVKKATTDEVLQVAIAAKLQTASGEVLWAGTTQTSGGEPLDKDNVSYAEIEPLLDQAISALADAYVKP